MRYTFKAYERLKREQHIDTLFRTGKAFSVFPLRIVCLIVPRTEGELSPVRIGFSVPKKKFRKATDRNCVKRLLREAWRMHKHDLYELVPEGRQLHAFLMYTDTEPATFETAQTAIVKSIDRLSKFVSGHE